MLILTRGNTKNLILVANSVDKIITHTTRFTNLSDNLGSILVGVAQLTYNMRRNLLPWIVDT